MMWLSLSPLFRNQEIPLSPPGLPDRSRPPAEPNPVLPNRNPPPSMQAPPEPSNNGPPGLPSRHVPPPPRAGQPVSVTYF